MSSPSLPSPVSELATTRTLSTEEFNRILDFPETSSLEASAQYDLYRVDTPVFEGPLDLLLHLIRRDQLNIYDIPIAHICESYLQQLNRMAHPDVNLAGEFFAMASTLIYLKSLSLVPQDPDEEQEDPRLPLVAQLVELEAFKKASVLIDQREWLDRDLYVRPHLEPLDVPVESLLDAPLEPIEIFGLLVHFKRSLDRTNRPPLDITTDPISIREKIDKMRSRFTEIDVLEFKDLIVSSGSRLEIVVSFLAILELAKLKFIEIIQTENYGCIQLKKVQSLDALNFTLLDQY